jgi:hypothetical protein
MAAADASQTDSRAYVALRLLPLADDLQRLGYPYEAYQLREAAAPLRYDHATTEERPSVG